MFFMIKLCVCHANKQCKKSKLGHHIYISIILSIFWSLIEVTTAVSLAAGRWQECHLVANTTISRWAGISVLQSSYCTAYQHHHFLYLTYFFHLFLTNIEIMWWFIHSILRNTKGHIYIFLWKQLQFDTVLLADLQMTSSANIIYHKRYHITYHHKRHLVSVTLTVYNVPVI